jgi:hypothetical protein
MYKIIIRLTLVISILICLIGGISLIIFNLYTLENMNSPDFDLKYSLLILNIIIIIVCSIGLLMSIASLIVIEFKGIKTYDRILEGIELSTKSITNLTNLNFPEEDELGNFGRKVQNLIRIIASFDEMKKTIIKKQSSQLDFIIDNTTPFIMLDQTYYITKVNESFMNTFHISNPVGKSIYDVLELLDCNLKAMADSYEKQTVDSKIKTENQIFNAIVNFKRFTNENDFFEYIIIFSNVEIVQKKESEDDDKENSFKE